MSAAIPRVECGETVAPLKLGVQRHLKHIGDVCKGKYSDLSDLKLWDWNGRLRLIDSLIDSKL